MDHLEKSIPAQGLQQEANGITSRVKPVEKQRLFSAIQSVNKRSQLHHTENSMPSAANGTEEELPILENSGAIQAHQALSKSHPHLNEPARHPGDEAPSSLTPIPRPASPYTLNPPIDFDGLSWPSLGTRDRLEASPEQERARIAKISGAVKTILECLGEDPEREGLLGTPERYANAILFFTKGYEENVRDIVNGAVFQEDHDELVIVKDIEVFSLCEHHLVPFTGKV